MTTLPRDIAAQETADFIASGVAPPAQILEVGCGDGGVAGLLSRRGYRVTALDEDAEVVARARERGVSAQVAIWPRFEHPPVDALVFTRSLHHMNPLPAALQRARELLVPGGVLLIEDFAFAEATADAIAWFVDVIRSPAVRELVRPLPRELVPDLLASRDPVATWRRSHDHHLPSMNAMLAALARQFVVRDQGLAPYLYRYLVPVLPETEAAGALVRRVLEEERALGAGRPSWLIGRRVLASPRAPGR